MNSKGQSIMDMAFGKGGNPFASYLGSSAPRRRRRARRKRTMRKYRYIPKYARQRYVPIYAPRRRRTYARRSNGGNFDIGKALRQGTSLAQRGITYLRNGRQRAYERKAKQIGKAQRERDWKTMEREQKTKK